MFTDLGLINQLIVVLSYAREVVVFDDGTASYNRTEKRSKILEWCWRLLSVGFIDKQLFYYSKFPRVFENQKGCFNQGLRISDVFPGQDKGIIKNTLFFLSAGSHFDGLNLSRELALFYRLKNRANKQNMSFKIIPHPKHDEHMRTANYDFYEDVLLIDSIFEFWYIKHSFANCQFCTLYSGALSAVETDNPRFFISGVFKPKIQRTVASTLFFRPRPRFNGLFVSWKKQGIHSIDWNSL